MVHRRHVPKRLCAGCGRRQDRWQLVRFRLGDDSGRSLVLDIGGKGSGRGVYTCANLDCFDQAVRKKTLFRRLGAASAPPGLREEFIRFSGKAKDNGKKKSLRDSQRT